MSTVKQNRRTFIQQVATGTGALLLPPFLKELPVGSKMKLGLVTYLWGQDWDIPTLIANCEKTKLYGVELRVEHAHGVGLDTPASRRSEIKKMFADSKVKVLGMGTNESFHYTDSKELQKNIDQAKAFVQLSHDIGGTGVKVKPNALPKGVAKEKTLEQIGKSLAEVGKIAADYGQLIRVEVHGNETQELPNMKAIMDFCDHPNVKICWNSNPEDLIGQGLVYNFNLVKEYFGDTVHVREMNLGDYPYQELMNLFVSINYKGWVLLECRTNPSDRIAAINEQHSVFQQMLKQARKAQSKQ